MARMVRFVSRDDYISRIEERILVGRDKQPARIVLVSHPEQGSL